MLDHIGQGFLAKAVQLLFDLRPERQALARYTQDAGNHVSVETHPVATLALP